MQIKAEKTTVAGDHLEIAAAKSKSVFKGIGLSRQETRDRMTFLVENFTQCNCTRTGLKRDGKKLGQFLVMGHKDRARLSLTFVMKINKKSCEMREALRAIRNAAICKNTSRANDSRQGAVFTNNDKNQSDNVANALMSSKCMSRTLTTAQRSRVTKRMTRVTASPPPKRRISPTSRSRVTKTEPRGMTTTTTTTKRGRWGVTRTTASLFPVTSTVQTQTLSSALSTSDREKRKKGNTETKAKELKTTPRTNNKNIPKDSRRQ